MWVGHWGAVKGKVSELVYRRSRIWRVRYDNRQLRAKWVGGGGEKEHGRTRMGEWFEAEEHVERAHELYEAGRWDEAEAELRRALSMHPDRAEWHFNLGLTLEAAGRYEDARRAFGDALELEPSDPQVMLMLGVACVRCDRFTEGIRWLEQSHEADPTRADTFVHRIDAYARLGKHDEAEQMFYSALQYDEENALAYAHIAESLMDRGDYARAVYCLKEAGRLEPMIPRLSARLAHAQSQQGSRDEALELYLKELREHPGDVDTLLDCGCLLMDMGRSGEAGEKFRRVIELESDNPDAHFYLGELALDREREEEAVSHYTIALKLDPAYPDVRRRLARVAIDRGDVSTARRMLRRELRRLKERVSDEPRDVVLELCELLLDARLMKDATCVLVKFTERKPEDAEALHLLSVAYFQQGNRGLGMQACRRSLRIDPKRVSALHNMALACVQEGRWERAGSYLQQGLAIAPDDHSLRRLQLTIRLKWLVRLGGWLLGRSAKRTG